MRLIRYLSMFAMLTLSIATWGQNTDDFNPDSPGEPSQPILPDTPTTPTDTTTYYTLSLAASEGGTISAGAGKHAAQEKVTVTASAPAQNFVFVCWTTQEGDTIKVQPGEGAAPVVAGRSFTYTMPTHDVTLIAHYDFQPGSPAEPTKPDIEDNPGGSEEPGETKTLYTLSLFAEEGGTVAAGAGTYEAGTVITVTASAAATNFRFGAWTTLSGDTIKVQTAEGAEPTVAGRSFSYTMPASDITLVARYDFVPGSPAEPDEPNLPIVEPEPEPKPKHLLTVMGEEGGTITLKGENITGLKATVEVEEEASIAVSSSLNTNFVFAGWYSADTLYTTSRSFTFVMDSVDHVFRARYDYQPGSPAEPAMPATKKQELYLMSVIGLPGETINYPLYLNSNDTIRDVLFQIQFPKNMNPDFEHASLSPQAKGYSFTYRLLEKNNVKPLHVKSNAVNPLDVLDENVNDDENEDDDENVNVNEKEYNVYEIKLTGGSTPPGNTALLIVPVEIEEEVEQERHRIWLSQVQVMNNEGTLEGATTRNGAINTNYVEPDTYSYLDNLISVGSSVWEITQPKQYDPPTPQTEYYDMQSLAQALVCSSPEFITFKGRSGEAEVTDEQTAENGFWYNKEGFVCGAEDVDRAMSVVYDAEQSSITFTQYPGAYNPGDKDTIRVYFTYKYKYYEVEMHINVTGNDYYTSYTNRLDSLSQVCDSLQEHIVTYQSRLDEDFRLTVSKTVVEVKNTADGYSSVLKELMGAGQLATDAQLSEIDRFINTSAIQLTEYAAQVATFTSVQYTITFDTQGAGEIAPITLWHNDGIVAPASPTKTGYTFVGWKPEVPETMPAEDVNVTAQWQINSYTLTFTVDGELYHQQQVEYNAKPANVNVPTKTGYTFLGWEPELPETMPAENVNVTAQWQINSYTLTFTVDGELYHQQQVEYNAKPANVNVPTKTGYTFVGWNAEIPELMPANNLTFEAMFTVNQYQLIYYVDGTEYHRESVNYGETITAIDEPTKRFYTFSGWSDIPQTMPAEDVKVYGVFTLDVVVPDEKGMLVIDNPDGMLKELMTQSEGVRELTVTGHLTPEDVDYIVSKDDLLVLHWDSDEELPASLQNSANANMIIYVNTEVPIEGGFEKSQNVVQDGKVNSLVLTDGYPLLIPESFTASTATYSKLFEQKTVQGRASGWKTIVLPYDVQTFTEEGSEASIAPFGATVTADKQFWLAGLSSNGFAYTDKMEANVPYIIAMPNSPTYKDELNISGQVRFESHDVLVQATTDAQTTTDNQYVFVPTYEPAHIAKAYAINDAPYRSYPVGSVFVRDYRNLRPFEGYLMLAPQMKYTPYIKVDDMMLDQPDIIPHIADTDAGSHGVYNLNGQRLQSAKSLPTGVYIINKKKMVVK